MGAVFVLGLVRRVHYAVECQHFVFVEPIHAVKGCDPLTACIVRR